MIPSIAFENIFLSGGNWNKCKFSLGVYRIFGIIRYPARNQVSGWIRYPVSGTKQYLVLSGILYPVESHIRYYPVHYQFLPAKHRSH